MNKSFLQKGFTLVELLIVMAILAVLAVGVLIGINPIEQINRSRDTAVQDTIGQLIQAYERYNAAQGTYPWGTLAAAIPMAALTSANANVTALTNTNELKKSILTSTELGKVYLYVASSQSYTLCYQPTSKAYQWMSPLEQRNNWLYMNNASSVPTDCNGNGTAPVCTAASYLCIANQ